MPSPLRFEELLLGLGERANLVGEYIVLELEGVLVPAKINHMCDGFKTFLLLLLFWGGDVFWLGSPAPTVKVLWAKHISNLDLAHFEKEGAML